MHKHLRRLHDPRLNRRKRHFLADILTIAVCAVLAGVNTWPDIETFARKRRVWLQRFLEMANGIPSHDTFERVFDRPQPQTLQAALLSWLHEISAVLGVRHIAIDGKTLHHSGGGSSPLRYLHLVSAWAVEANLTLGQAATDEKSIEIEAITASVRPSAVCTWRSPNSRATKATWRCSNDVNKLRRSKPRSKSQVPLPPLAWWMANRCRSISAFPLMGTPL